MSSEWTMQKINNKSQRFISVLIHNNQYIKANILGKIWWIKENLMFKKYIWNMSQILFIYLIKISKMYRGVFTIFSVFQEFELNVCRMWANEPPLSTNPCSTSGLPSFRVPPISLQNGSFQHHFQHTAIFHPRKKIF